MATSGWDKVFESPSTYQDMSSSPTTRRVRPNLVYEIDDYITIIFNDCEHKRERVVVETIFYGELYFSNAEFEEFINTFDSFNTCWMDINIIIGKYTTVFTRNGAKRSLKFYDAFTDKYMFRWTEKLIRLFSKHTCELYKLNRKWFPE